MSVNRSRICLLLLEKCKNMEQLKQAHAQAIACGLGNNSFAFSRILAFCSEPKRGSLSHALNLFQRIQQPTICICNTMLKAFLLRDELKGVFDVYSSMLRNDMCPDAYTLPYVLKACAKLQSSFHGELVHGCCLKLGFLVSNVVGNSLISMYCGFGIMRAASYIFEEIPSPCPVSWTLMISGYAKVGDVDTATLLFDEAPIKDRGIWGAMISGYAQNSCFKECLYMFKLMQLGHVVPDEGILSSVLCACAQLGALETGVWIHTYLERSGMHVTSRLSTGLVDMYAKCGNLDIAKEVFDGMSHRDTVSWNVMISGFAMHGDGKGALKVFSEMEEAGFRPDDVTFIAILSACSYSGMGYDGLRVLNRMRGAYNIEPKSKHYGCMVDLLTKAGLLKEASEIIQSMPSSSSSSEEAIAWRTLLNACCSQGQGQLAEVAAEKLTQLEIHSGAYVLLSNFYAATGNYDNAERVREKMRNRGVDKAPGCSSIKINGMVNEFVAGEKTHPQMGEVESILKKITKHLNYLWWNPDFLLFDKA